MESPSLLFASRQMPMPEETDESLLERIAHGAFGYFVEQYNAATGLIADSSDPGDPCSIAAVGFALSCYPIGVERGWMPRAEAIARTLAALRFFANSEQSHHPDATGYKGFYRHFIDIQTGKPAWRSEVSLIDTTLLLAGMLVASVYFDGADAQEAEIRATVDALYRRMDWEWACDNQPTARQGWRPKGGFLHYGWDGYDEATILYILGLASPTHPLPANTFDAWTHTYQWEEIYGYTHLYAGPLFIHHFSQAWIDFRGIRDAFMREKKCDYAENTRRATLMQIEYARRNPHGFVGYSEKCWGLSASRGVGFQTREVERRLRHFLGYSARGAPYGPDDGTIAPCEMLASLPFTSERCLESLRHMLATFPEVLVDGRLASGFNPTLPGKGPGGWVANGHLGLDQGIVVMMIENYRTGLTWSLMKRCPYVVGGLRRAGFSGGWLSEAK
ncbi:glucoamylase family protein [Methylocystis sp. IM3]|uniref:glucoamylase family protein n=2 Tax=Methylocystis TaxID=133 RepID=UPI0030F73FBF